MAAYGEPKYINLFKDLIVHKDGKFKNIGGVFLRSALKSIRSALPTNFKKEDLAATIQRYVENMVVDYVKYWLGKTGGKNTHLLEVYSQMF